MTTEFTPIASLIGGSLIGFSALLLMLGLGRVMGATGILAGVLLPKSLGECSLRLAVLLVMFSAPWFFSFATGSFPEINIPGSTSMLILGGLVVGVGVTISNGCTSGHGVCGLARLSQRSLVAVISFMVSTAITVYIVRHIIGL